MTTILLSITTYLVVYGLYQRKAVKIQTKEYLEKMRKQNERR